MSMIVKVSWTEHTREYTISLETFLKTMGIDATEEQIIKASKYLLEQNDMKPTDGN